MLTDSVHTNRGSNTSSTGRLRGSSRLYAKTPLSLPVQVATDTGRGASVRKQAACGTAGAAPSPLEPVGSVLCVGDDQDTAGALAESLRKLGCLVHLASGAESGLETILAQGPDLILCHSCMPGMSGLEFLAKLAHSGSDYARQPFILVTSGHDRDSELAARRLGADDCLTAPVDLEILGAIVDNRLRRKARGPSSSGRPPLTEREKDVLTWVARGKTSGEIAIILGLSERTVNFHCEQAMKRLDVMNRTQAVAQAIWLKLIAI